MIRLLQTAVLVALVAGSMFPLHRGVGADSHGEGSAPTFTQQVEKPHTLLSYCVKCHGWDANLSHSVYFDKDGFVRSWLISGYGLEDRIKSTLRGKGVWTNLNKTWIPLTPDERLQLQHALEIYRIYGRKPFIKE